MTVSEAAAAEEELTVAGRVGGLTCCDTLLESEEAAIGALAVPAPIISSPLTFGDVCEIYEYLPSGREDPRVKAYDMPEKRAGELSGFPSASRSVSEVRMCGISWLFIQVTVSPAFTLIECGSIPAGVIVMITADSEDAELLTAELGESGVLVFVCPSSPDSPCVTKNPAAKTIRIPVIAAGLRDAGMRERSGISFSFARALEEIDAEKSSLPVLQ